jgi:hypothetical protein
MRWMPRAVTSDVDKASRKQEKELLAIAVLLTGAMTAQANIGKTLPQLKSRYGVVPTFDTPLQGREKYKPRVGRGLIKLKSNSANCPGRLISASIPPEHAYKFFQFGKYG